MTVNTDPNAAQLINWTGGEAVPGNPFQRRVNTTNSEETTVTASVGSTSMSVNVWVIWANITFVTSGTNPAANLITFNNASPNYNGDQLGVQYSTNTNRAVGKICIVATLTPAGICSNTTSGWNFIQEKTCQVYGDGTPVSMLSYSNWVDDSPLPSFKTIIPDSNNNLYSIDAPNIAPIAVPTTEVYYNFYDYITWNSQVVSSTNNYWHFQARYNYYSIPQIPFADLGTGTIIIPTNSFYPQQ
jgi:hypothetical protein